MNPIWPVIFWRALAAALLAPMLARALKLPRFALSVPAALLVSLSCFFTFVGHWTWGLPIVSRVKTRRRLVFLTFDDGPSPDVTPRILEILAEFDAAATFFVLGDAARRHPEILRRIADASHAIGLHGNRHRSLVFTSPAELRAEIDAARDAIFPILPVGFRPPHGFKTLLMPFLVKKLGLRQFAWTLNPRDYLPDASPSQIADFVASNAFPGAIVLLHDGSNQSKTADSLPLILRRLREYGYECASLQGSL